MTMMMLYFWTVWIGRNRTVVASVIYHDVWVMSLFG